MGQENSVLKGTTQNHNRSTSEREEVQSAVVNRSEIATPSRSNAKTEKEVTVAGVHAVLQFMDFPFITEEHTVSYVNDSKVMFVMRGLPGSGKSEITKILQSIYRNTAVCSADDYFLHDGRYEFNKDCLRDAHEFCQKKARDACENDVNVVIIDNTNVKRWEPEFYFDLADEYSYVVILVEPQTPWKFEAVELARRNRHGAQQEFLSVKLQQWELVIPLYFGWFLNESDSRMLHLVGQAHLEECLKIPDFAEDFKKFSDATQMADMLQYYSVPPSCPKGMLHCTSKFCLGGKVPDASKYATDPVICTSCGRCYELCVVGFLLTPRTFGARVKLDSEMLCLWGNDDEGAPRPRPTPLVEKFVPMNKNLDENNTAISKHGKEHFAHCKASLICCTKVENPTFRPTSGVGSKAHITLGCARGFSAVTTGFDLVEIVNCENDPSIVEKCKTYNLQRGWLRDYGESRWMLYLQQYISVQSLFTGHYKLSE